MFVGFVNGHLYAYVILRLHLVNIRLVLKIKLIKVMATAINGNDNDIAQWFEYFVVHVSSNKYLSFAINFVSLYFIQKWFQTNKIPIGTFYIIAWVEMSTLQLDRNYLAI